MNPKPLSVLRLIVPVVDAISFSSTFVFEGYRPVSHGSGAEILSYPGNKVDHGPATSCPPRGS
jgi:hypothetical protein